MEKKQPIWEDLKGIFGLISLYEGILGLSLNSSIADSITPAFERIKEWLLGGRGKGIDVVETIRNVKGKEQRRRFGGLWWRFKQKELWKSSKSSTPCAEARDAHEKKRLRSCLNTPGAELQSIDPPNKWNINLFLFLSFPPPTFYFSSGNWDKLWGYNDMLSTNSEFKQILHIQNVKGLTPKLPQHFSKLKGN